MFRGISAVNLDAKGRMAVPARYRLEIEKEAQSQLIVTIDTDQRCLLLYPLPEWEIIERKIEALPSFNPTARRIQRLLIGHATEVELDSNGRILLPPLLREYAAIDKRVMLVGQGKKFEIWDEGQWQGGRDEWLAQRPLLETDLPEELRSLSL
jgi:MraZ protein